ncbi:hypothetical protein [Mycobacteroides chelonae]|nr:hypothetical protein [Mycobacteroides chelonae]
MVAWSLWYGALPGWYVRYQSLPDARSTRGETAHENVRIPR